MNFSRLVGLASIAAASAAVVSCGRLPGREPPPATVWLLPSPEQAELSQSQSLPSEIAAFEGALIVIDTSALSPVEISPVSAAAPGSSRIVYVTTYRGSRYHPETIRALTDDQAAAATFASRVATAAARSGNGMFIDFQGATPDELTRNASILRAITDSARSRNISPIGVIVPPGDTIAYPTRVLARTFDLIVVRLNGEHRPGTGPGPLVSPGWMSRQIGMRAAETGVNRLVAELPLFGYKWDRSGAAVRITFAEAQSLVRSEAGSFRRDPATGSLTASSSRNGWTIWIQDAVTLDKLISVARELGIRRFALIGPDGADPAIWISLPSALRR